MSLAFDESGRPFIVLREQEKKQRVKGLDAHKVSRLPTVDQHHGCSHSGESYEDLAWSERHGQDARQVRAANHSPDGEVIITNDGATILEKMEVEHQTARLLVNLSQSQDNEIGDGTTGVVVFAGALLEQAMKLLEKGIHPLKIADGFEQACDIAVKRINEIAEPIDITKNDHAFLKKCAITSLGSKVVSQCQEHFAEIAVNAVLSVADLERRDVNFDLIKIVAKTGGQISDTTFVEGIIIDKDFSHPQMPKEVRDAKVAILTCPFEPPKPKTKHGLEIKSAEDYKALYEMEQKYFTD